MMSNKNPINTKQKESPGFKNRGLQIFLYCSLALTDFLDTCSFTLQIAQVVELGTTDPTNHHHINLVNARSMQWEDSLNTHAVRHFSHGEGRTNTIVVTPALN
jgi:hypothetical protein